MSTKQGLSRRNFIKQTGLSSSIILTGLAGLINFQDLFSAPDAAGEFPYPYRSVSVEHLPEIKAWFGKLFKEGAIAKNETFRSYIEFDFDFEKEFAGAKSILIVATPQKIGAIDFTHQGKVIRGIIPTGYSYNGVDPADLESSIRQKILNSDTRMLKAAPLPYKTLAARSGLSEYGLNNITFTREYGSFYGLSGYYTDVEMPDQWREHRLMRLCRGCSICKNDCPTKCIRDEQFVVDIDHCLTLYNEQQADFPDWMDSKIHHSIVGCLKCQWNCPANVEAIKDIQLFGTLNENETAHILSDSSNEKMEKEIAEKVKLYPSASVFSYFRRNVGLMLRNKLNN